MSESTIANGRYERYIKHRYHNDPEFRERVLESQRAYCKRRYYADIDASRERSRLSQAGRWSRMTEEQREKSRERVRAYKLRCKQNAEAAGVAIEA